MIREHLRNLAVILIFATVFYTLLYSGFNR